MTILVGTASGASAGIPQCTGDCGGMGAVDAADLRDGVRVALGTELAICVEFDANGDQRVTIEELVRGVRNARNGCVPARSLASSSPPHNGVGILRTIWPELFLAEAEELGGFALRCDGIDFGLTVATLSPIHLVLNPSAELPPSAECELRWSGPHGDERLPFRTAAAGAPFTALYDPRDPRRVAPYPDDRLLVEDASQRTGLRLAMASPEAASDVKNIFDDLLHDANQLDGFSPIGHFVVDFDAPLAPASVPRTPRDSLDALATVALFDMTPARESFGQRVPFRADVRDDDIRGRAGHTLLIYPSVPLTPRGRYGLVIQKRAFADAGRPLEPSEFFSAALADASEGESESVTKVRGLAREVLSVALGSQPPILPDDVALALSIRIRSTDDIPRDVLAMKEKILADPPPSFSIDSVAADPTPNSAVGAIVRGTWQAPDFRPLAQPNRPSPYLQRDEEGLPVQARTRGIPFVLAIPKSAVEHPAPITMHQHGNPGSLEEVVGAGRRFLGAANFAAAGFTDILNREVAPSGTSAERETAQTLDVLTNLLFNQRLPEHWVETKAEQLAFLRMLPTFGSIDVLPLGAPDGIPDLDAAAPLTYHGISEGANNGQGLVAYAPEIRAAALVVGGARLVETLIHQQAEAFLVQLPLFVPNVTPTDLWVGFSLFQADYDVQDNHNHAPFLYRQKLAIGDSERRASLLVLEGLDDSLVPNHATNSMAWSFGPLPHVRPVQRDTVILTTDGAPLTANIDSQTTAGFYQYVPARTTDAEATPSCAAVDQTEGHFCPQVALESNLQRTIFFQTALSDPAPTIIDPLAMMEGMSAEVESAADGDLAW